MTERSPAVTLGTTVTSDGPTVQVALADPRSAAERDAREARYQQHGVLGRGGRGEVRLVPEGMGALVGALLYVRSVVRVEAELRHRWLMHDWHLQQLAHLDEAAA